MIDGWRIVPIIPSGRKTTMQILIKSLRRFDAVIDEVQIHQNTGKDQEVDRKWLYQLPDLWKKCKIYEYPLAAKERFGYGKLDKLPIQLNTGKFYKYTQDKGTLYFRFDDDLVYIDDSYFKNIVKFRLEHPEYFLVFGNIINNAINSHVLQKKGLISTEMGEVSEYCMDDLGWWSGKFAEYLHRTLLEKIAKNKVSDLFYDHYPLGHTRFSISNFCFFGSDMAIAYPEIDDEEVWLAEYIPRDYEIENVICGSALVAQYTFCGQREHMAKTDILAQYDAVSKQKLSDGYYNLLNIDEQKVHHGPVRPTKKELDARWIPRKEEPIVVEKEPEPVVVIPGPPPIHAYADNGMSRTHCWYCGTCNERHWNETSAKVCRHGKG